MYGVLESVVSVVLLNPLLVCGLLGSDVSVSDPPLVYRVLGTNVLLLTSACGVRVVPAQILRH